MSLYLKFFPIVIVTMAISSCGGGGGGGGATPTITPAPQVTLTSSDSELLVGNSATLTWSSSNATSCSASGDWSGSKDSDGSESISVDNAKVFTYTLECTGVGGSASNSVSVLGYQEMQGVSVDGYIRSADIFIDKNDNFEADAEESATVSNNDGTFGLRYSAGNLISLGGFDLDTGNLLDKFLIINKLTEYSGFSAITPITTLAAFMENPSDINSMLGIDSSINVSITDPVAVMGDRGIYDYLYEKGNQATILVLALQNITNDLNVSTDTSQDYFNSLAQVLEAEFDETGAKVDIETNIFLTKVFDNVVAAKALSFSEDNRANVIAVLSAIIPVIEVKASSAINTALFGFATSTLQADLLSFAKGTATVARLNSYTSDILNYIVTDTNVLLDDIVPNVIAVADAVSTNANTAVQISVLNNDFYDSSKNVIVTIGVPLVGTATVLGGVVSYTPPADYNGIDSLDYTITQSGKSSTAAISVTIVPADGASVIALADAVSTNEESAVTFNPLANDSIPAGDYTISVSAGAASNGSIVVNSGNTLTYTPSVNFFGTDSFTYKVTVNSVSSSAIVTVTVNGVNDLPIINSLSSEITPDENQTSVVTVNATDVETVSLTYSLSGTDSSLFSISSSGVITFNSAPDYEAPGDAGTDNSYAVTVMVGDGTDTVSQAVVINVQNVADQVSGVAVDGYVAGATVFQDLDNDGVLDSGEPNTSTNALGSFTLNLSSVNKSAPVRIINGYDLATNEIHPSVMDISVTETGSYVITPISTLVGRLKIADTTISGTVPQSMIAASLGIAMADSPNDSILGFDPIAYFNGSDTTLASEARPVFAASQLLMAQGGGNYGVNKYITDQVLSSLSSTLTTQSGSSISMSSSADITAIKQDAYDAIFNGIVDTTLANNPPINNVQFKNNKAVMTDYLNGSSSSQVQHSLYGVHDGSTTLVADLVGAKLDYENLKQIIDNDGTGTPLDLSFELSSLPVGSGTTSVNLRLFYGSDAVQDSDEDYLQVALTADWESDGTTLQIKLPASSSLVATFFDRSGTSLSRTVTNATEDIITAANTGPNRPQSLKIRLSTLFDAFPTEVSGLSSFLDGAASFTYQVEFGSFTIYDHLENPFTKIQGSFGVNSTPSLTVFADDIYVHENATTKDITFRLSQASSSNVTVDYAISGSSTASSADYTLSAGTVTIPAGSTSATLAIAVTNDSVVEPQEELRLSLSSVQNAVLGRTTVSAYITDGEKILDNATQKAILVNNIFKDSKISINEYVKSKLDSSSVTISGISYTYSQVLVNNSLTSDVYAYVDSIVDDYEIMAEAVISAIMTKSNTYVDSQLSGFSSYIGFAQALTQLNSGLKGLNVSQIVGTNISNDGTYPSGQSAATLLTAVEGKVDTLVTLAADTVADILGTDTNANFPNANVIIGTDGNDTITGTSGSDLIASFNGTDIVNGAAGNDKILGGSGVDTINGGDNDDHIYGYAGADILAGDADADKILGGLDNDTIRGGAGDDDLRGEAGNDTIYTGTGSDTVTGGLGDDTIVIDSL